MAKDPQPVGLGEQKMFSKGTVSDKGIGGAPDSDAAAKAYAVSKPYAGDRSPTPPKADR